METKPKAELKPKMETKPKRKVRLKLLIFALIEFACLILAFLISYYFAIPAVLFMLLGQREIWGKRIISAMTNKFIST